MGEDKVIVLHPGMKSICPVSLIAEFFSFSSRINQYCIYENYIAKLTSTGVLIYRKQAIYQEDKKVNVQETP